MKRYLRQEILPEIGPEGQAKRARAQVVVAGAGGLGSTLLPLLAGAGVGRITVFDPDRVEEHNLHRQTIYRMARSWRAEGRGGGAASFRSQPRQALGCGAVLVKGGDAPARRPCKDRLFAQPGALPLPFRGPRFAQSIRGTGCRLASDIAAGRVRRDDQPAAVARSRALLMAEFAELADGGKRAGIPFGPRFPSLKMSPQPRHGPGHGHTTSAGKLPSACPRRQPARSARPVDFDAASLAHCPRLARHIRPAPQSADANPQAHSSS